jgi:hypothetical protein
MEIDGDDIWAEVRRTVVETGPMKVLRRMVKAGACIDDVVHWFVDQEDATELLSALGGRLPKGISTHDAAVDKLLRRSQQNGPRTPQANASCCASLMHGQHWGTTRRPRSPAESYGR